jgi:DNA-binding transcriptional regulator YiaG
LHFSNRLDLVVLPKKTLLCYNQDKEGQGKLSSKRKVKTLVYEGLGFPITLFNTPMRKIFGEWVIDIDMTQLQLVVLRALVFKSGRLTKDELQFIRKFLSLTTAQFGRIFGVTHAAVIQWENGKRQLTPSTEFCIRLHVLGHLRAKATEFRDLYNAVPLEVLAKEKLKTTIHLEIDVYQSRLSTSKKCLITNSKTESTK